MKTNNPSSDSKGIRGGAAPGHYSDRTGQPGKASHSRAGNGNGNAKAKEAVSDAAAAKLVKVLTNALKQADAAKPKANAPAKLRYDEGAHFDMAGQRYVSADPVPPTPPPGGAKVRLELATRTDADLAAFAEAHVTAMTGNTNFTNPSPSTAVFGQWLADFEGKLAEIENLKVIMKNLTEQKDQIRAGFQAVFTQRGQYIEVASDGNADIIATSGLPLRRQPTRVGDLPWPLSLRVDQSQSTGVLILRWAAVTNARGYVLQCAEVTPDEPRVWNQVYMGGKFTSTQKNLVPGKTYEFRVAAIGGTSGQSEWSPVVSRMAA